MDANGVRRACSDKQTPDRDDAKRCVLRTRVPDTVRYRFECKLNKEAMPERGGMPPRMRTTFEPARTRV